MKKTKITLTTSVCLLSLFCCGCGQKNQKVTTQTATEIKTEALSENTTELITTEEILASGQNNKATDTDSTKSLPDVIAPADDHSIFNPTISNASIINPEHYNREDLLLYIKMYIYNTGMVSSECSEIHFDEKLSDTSYKATLITDKGNSEIIINYVREKYYISQYGEPGSGESAYYQPATSQEEE